MDKGGGPVDDELVGLFDLSHDAFCIAGFDESGVISPIAEVRQAMDSVGHSVLLLVDAVSSLGCIEYRHDEWGVDVTVAGSQKGLMLPPGISFNAISEKALDAATSAGLSAQGVARCRIGSPW
jgi:alanine-glyoxylate transaminase / serine-glyoxylate transaminase / serine-pyruvate transaminase